MRRAIPVTLLSFCALFLSCCECSPFCAPAVKYEVTGMANSVSVEFNDEHGDRDKFNSIEVPWVKSFTIKFRSDEYYGGRYTNGIYPAYVSAQVLDGIGNVTVSIYIDGRLMKSVSTTAENRTATAQYAIRL